MMSLDEIRRLSNKVAEKAAQEKRRPYRPFDLKEVRGYGENPIPFPHLGTYQPPGWKLVEKLFVDKSGCGLEGEPALTLEFFKKKVVSYMKQGHQYGYAILEEGQFQVWVGVFKQTIWAVK